MRFGYDEGRSGRVARTARRLSEGSLWGRDLTGAHPRLVEEVAGAVESLLDEGVTAAVARYGAGLGRSARARSSRARARSKPPKVS